MGVKQINYSGALLINFPAENERVVVYVENNKIIALNDKCPHRGGPIHLCKKHADGTLECLWHGNIIKKPAMSKNISAIYYRSTGKVILVSVTKMDREWPVKTIS
ncbi:Rieske 2Fe-2S domain-containing protein [Xenorhabdus miraniensis]|uniref:Toluene-4-sulfonate monooxygenase system iron-sulfur subunit TsaM1 n=1 Tax=Xenorhabdus miraniensis TaxID=351674 RepID=A0A2D0JSR5_9GAMM|nr:Rieske 2Fe-2S domain-containing protein [Xenorhabdus miraniensis]PHM49394.1 Toluene-4-sulfonate monooxygenase system iron-sulfur subunit TsaM1 [Xenorhabdus miraniensis]